MNLSVPPPNLWDMLEQFIFWLGDRMASLISWVIPGLHWTPDTVRLVGLVALLTMIFLTTEVIRRFRRVFRWIVVIGWAVVILRLVLNAAGSGN